MARFECNWCGKCCRNFGTFMKIERRLMAYSYYCWHGITNKIFPVHAEPQYVNLFSDTLDDLEPADTGSRLRKTRKSLFQIGRV